MIDLAASLIFCRTLWTEEPKREKHPHDLLRQEVLIERVKPAVVVETGLHWGYGARWWASRVPYLVTVERDAQMLYDWRRDRFGERPPNVVVFDGDSILRAEDVCSTARDLAEGGPVLVVLDSDHGRPHVLRELEAYGPIVTPGSYMVAEDGIYHYFEPGPRHGGNWYEGDAVEAVEEFCAHHDGWTIDTDLEDLFPCTLNPSGYLRRS